MFKTITFPHTALALAGALLVLGGCSSSREIAFTNVSNTALNIEFYALDASAPNAGTTFVRQKRAQVATGDTVEYAVPKSAGKDGGDVLVHMQIEPVVPSWEPDPMRYWLEMLTTPPITIVATGKSDAIVFETGTGSVVRIPKEQMEQGRYDYRLAPVDEQASADEAGGQAPAEK